ncbi:MAG: YfhO family protein, partial [Nitrososphaerales archaeon]
RLLDLTGVRYVITDKQRDLWAGDVYYDLEQPATVPAHGRLDLDLSGYPPFPANALGIVAQPAEPVTISVSMADGAQAALALHSSAAVAAATPTPTILRFPAGVPVHISVVNPSGEALLVEGLSLIDERDGAQGARAHQSVTLSPQGDFRRIHSGDVKIYERLGALGRAWLVHGVLPVADAEAAQAAIAEPAFAPRAEATVEGQVMAAAPASAAGPGEGVTMASYTGEQQSYRVQAKAPGLLVVADAWYPGWRATVDGQPAEILRANLLYRAVALQPGEHEVVFEYEPRSWRAGVIVSLAALLALIVTGLAAGFIRWRALLL